MTEQTTKKNIGRNIRAGMLIFNEPKFSCPLFQDEATFGE